MPCAGPWRGQPAVLAPAEQRYHIPTRARDADAAAQALTFRILEGRTSTASPRLLSAWSRAENVSFTVKLGNVIFINRIYKTLPQKIKGQQA